MAEINITQGQSGSDISAQVGDTVVVELPEIPGTGYRWAAAPSTTAVLALLGDDLQLEPTAAVGGGGKRIFRFAANGPGQAEVRLTLARSWEAQNPKETMSFRINVS